MASTVQYFDNQNRVEIHRDDIEGAVHNHNEPTNGIEQREIRLRLRGGLVFHTGLFSFVILPQSYRIEDIGDNVKDVIQEIHFLGENSIDESHDKECTKAIKKNAQQNPKIM